ncbi:MAG: GIY-YIG nuclease family protein [Candidatus Velamenicoccus archaeovorus]
MCFVYVLRSIKNRRRYVGHTSRDVQARLAEHNNGHNQWARQNGPFVLSYADECATAKEAQIFERFLKSGQGRQCLDELGI